MTRRAIKATDDTLTLVRDAGQPLVLRGQPLRILEGIPFEDAPWVACEHNDERVSAISLNSSTSGRSLDGIVGGGIVPVIVGAGGATAGRRAIVGPTGIENAGPMDPTGGATQQAVGQFLQSGVFGDIVGMHFYKYERTDPVTLDPPLGLSAGFGVNDAGRDGIIDWTDRSELSRLLTPVLISKLSELSWPGSLPEAYVAGDVDIQANATTGVSFAFSVRVVPREIEGCLYSIHSSNQLFEIWDKDEKWQVFDGSSWYPCAPTQQFQHISGSWSSGRFRFYVNGSLAASHSGITYFNDWTTYRIGSNRENYELKRFYGNISRHDFHFVVKSDAEHAAWQEEINAEFPLP